MNRAIVTVTARDRVGIIAEVCVFLANSGINILDISQTVMQDFLTMTMLVDLSGMTDSFEKLLADANAMGQEAAISMHIQREDIFNAMHRV